MHARRIGLLVSTAYVMVCVDVAAGGDVRIETAKRTLMTSYAEFGHDVVVETALDPTLAKQDRRQLLRFYLEALTSVERSKSWAREVFLPRLQRVYNEMPCEDPESIVAVLRGMAKMHRDKDGNDARVLGFLRQQLQQLELSPARRKACEMLLVELGAEAGSGEPPSASWRNDEQRILKLLGATQFGDAYRLAIQVVEDSHRKRADRLAALACLDELLARPTAIPFEVQRDRLEAVCVACSDPALADALAKSAMRAAFLEAMRPHDAAAVLERLKASGARMAAGAADQVLQRWQAEQTEWQLDWAKHLAEAEQIVSSAGLAAPARQEFRQLVASADYRHVPVGEGARWWILGKFLYRHQAWAASVEAFRRYLSARHPCSVIDGRLREAVAILRGVASESSQIPPTAFWVDLCARSRGAEAFVQALSGELAGAGKHALFIDVAKNVLRQHPQSDAAKAIVELSRLSAEDYQEVCEDLAETTESGWAKVGLAAALARMGEYGQAIRCLDLSLDEPLPGAPLFRVVGVAEAMWNAGNREGAEKLLRKLLDRDIPSSQRVKVLAYLMSAYLNDGEVAEAVRIQQELTERHARTDPEAVEQALSTCLADMRDKRNLQGELLTTRLLCQVLNEDEYPLTAAGAAGRDALRFWQAVLVWSGDHGQVDALREYVRDMPESVEADLGRVLLARTALDKADLTTAEELLDDVDESSVYASLAADQRTRLAGLIAKRDTLSSVVGKETQAVVEAAGREQRPIAVECHLLAATHVVDPSARLAAVAEAAKCCGTGQVDQELARKIVLLLEDIRPLLKDEPKRKQCDRLADEWRNRQAAASTTKPGEMSRALPESLAGTYAGAMHRIGLALRAAGKYEEALRCFHNGFLRAPFTDTAPDLLREEAWITCFYLGDIEKMLAVLRQAVAIYPCTDAGRWCSVRLRTHHFDNPPG